MFTRVCRLEELAGAARRVVQVNGQEVLVLRVQEEIVAIANRCPHRGGLLSEGDLLGEVLYCPLHAWCFDLQTGLAKYPQGACVQRFGVQVVAGWVEVAA